MKSIVVVPTYNEADNIAAFVPTLFDLNVPDLNVLIVDDESPDGTGKIADGLAAQNSCVQVMHRTGLRGLGRAYIDGFHWALAHGFERIIQMDADFSHSPSYIPVMLEKSDACDVVVGSRYIPGGSLDQEWEAGRVFLSAWANFYARGILRMQVHDATAGFKCWTRRALEVVQLDRVRSNGYVFQVEMAYLCQKLKLRVVEIPIHFEDRRIGHSKMSIPVKLEAAWRTWQVGWRHRKVK
ncbi:MAG TPA: polyprenol monophosphomannose synthase [Anaerolineae bacterium]|nr:polyprenol monophosphomannose synthase [Anaerolineae bacterium]